MIPSKTIPDDPVIRHLDSALNPGRMKIILQQRLLSSGNRYIQLCEIERIKYKPAKNCLVCYRLTIANRASETNVDILISARFYEPGGSKSRFRKASTNKTEQLQSGSIAAPVIHLPELDCVIWVFPNDRKIDSLALLNDEKRLKQLVFPRLIKMHWGQHWQLTELKSERVHYLPEHSCCVRTQVTINNAQSGENQTHVLYGKTNYNNQGQQAFNQMTQLWNSKLRKQGVLAIPQPVVYLAKYKTLWQLGVPGRPVQDWVKQHPDFYQRFDEIASQVAALHQSGISVEQQTEPISPDQKLNEVMALVSHIKPEINKLLFPLIAELKNTRPATSDRPEAVLHGDLHLKNVLADEQQVYLIDLDDLQSGDPLQDIGSLIATILYQSQIQVFSPAQAQQMIARFLYCYQNLVSWNIESGALRWYVAVALINERLSRSISRLKDGRLDNLHELVSLAAEIAMSAYTPAWCEPECCKTSLNRSATGAGCGAQ